MFDLLLLNKLCSNYCFERVIPTFIFFASAVAIICADVLISCVLVVIFLRVDQNVF